MLLGKGYENVDSTHTFHFLKLSMVKERQNHCVLVLLICMLELGDKDQDHPHTIGISTCVGAKSP